MLPTFTTHLAVVQTVFLNVFGAQKRLPLFVLELELLLGFIKNLIGSSKAHWSAKSFSNGLGVLFLNYFGLPSISLVKCLVEPCFFLHFDHRRTRCRAIVVGICQFLERASIEGLQCRGCEREGLRCPIHRHRILARGPSLCFYNVPSDMIVVMLNITQCIYVPHLTVFVCEIVDRLGFSFICQSYVEVFEGFKEGVYWHYALFLIIEHV